MLGLSKCVKLIVVSLTEVQECNPTLEYIIFNIFIHIHGIRGHIIHLYLPRVKVILVTEF